MSKVSTIAASMAGALDAMQDAVADTLEAQGDEIKSMVILATGRANNLLLHSGCTCPYCLGQMLVAFRTFLRAHDVADAEAIDPAQSCQVH